MELVNALPAWRDETVLADYVPEKHRNFTDPPTFSVKRAFNYLTNNIDVIRLNHHALETGGRLDYDMLNNVLREGVLRLVDWGDADAMRDRRLARTNVGGRLDTLIAVSRKDGVNPGTAFIQSTVERALFYFAQYVDYRFADAAYPDASPGKFQIKICLAESCGKLFVRTPETLLYCSDECARADR